MLAAFFALLSWALLAGNAVTVRVALLRATATTLALSSILTNLVTLWAIAAVSGSLSAALQPPALIFLGAGVLAPALARLALYTVIDLIGIRSILVSSTTPMFAAIGGALVLHEKVSGELLLGTVAVVLGVALTLSTRAVDEVRFNRIGLLLALGSAVLVSISLVLQKIGLRLIPEPALAGALTVTGALVGLLPLALLRLRREPIYGTNSALTPMILAGLFSSGGYLTYFLALNLGDVSRVTILINTAPLFAVLLMRLLFRHVESIPRRIFVGACLTMAAVILVLSG